MNINQLTKSEILNLKIGDSFLYGTPKRLSNPEFLKENTLTVREIDITGKYPKLRCDGKWVDQSYNKTRNFRWNFTVNNSIRKDGTRVTYPLKSKKDDVLDQIKEIFVKKN
jgi:hypothetical protein